MVDLDLREVESRLEAKDELCHVPLIDEEQYTSIGIAMAVADAKLIHQALKRNVDLFAWTGADIPGVNPEIITHLFSVYKEARRSRRRKETTVKRRDSRPESRPRSSLRSGSSERPDTLPGWPMW